MYLTIHEFMKQFPSEEACFEALRSLRYPTGMICPCGVSKFTKHKKRPVYQCSCGYQISILKGTIFAHSQLPLQYWFYALFLFASTKTGVSAMHLQRTLGITYNAAYRMGMKIRGCMKPPTKLKGVVEIDESYLKPKRANRFWYWRGNTKVLFGMIERKGNAVIKHVPNNYKGTLMHQIKQTIEPGSHIMSDQFSAYDYLKYNGYKHDTVLHRVEFVHGDAHTQNIECLWGNVKRGILGSYRTISADKLQDYMNEYAWRFNNRNGDIFGELLSAAVGA